MQINANLNNSTFVLANHFNMRYGWNKVWLWKFAEKTFNIMRILMK